MVYAADRAARDRIKLAKSVRTVRAGLALGLVTVADLTTTDIAAPITGAAA